MNTKKLIKEYNQYKDMCNYLMKNQKILDKYYTGDADYVVNYGLRLLNDLVIKLNQIMVVLDTVQEVNSIVHDFVEGELNDNK